MSGKIGEELTGELERLKILDGGFETKPYEGYLL